MERGDHRQDAGNRPDLAAERELTDQGDPARRGDHLLRAEQDPDRDGQIERGARLAQVRRRQVDRDPPRRMAEPGIADRPANPFPGLLERRIGKPDDREPRQSRGDVDLDPDDPAVEADEGGRQEGGQHRPTLSVAAHRPLTRPCTADHRPAPAGISSGREPTRLTGRRLVDDPGEVSSDRPRSESAFVNMNGAPEFRALIAPRYSFTTWWSIVRFNAPSAFLTLMPVNAFERFRTSWTLSTRSRDGRSSRARGGHSSGTTGRRSSRRTSCRPPRGCRG